MNIMTATFLKVIAMALIAVVSISTERVLIKAALRNPVRQIPNVLKRIVTEFAYYDWERLLDVFPETNESLKFRDYVKRYIRTGMWVTGNRKEPNWVTIELDDGGNIIEIACFKQQLTDSAIGDLSKLPSTLKRLNLNGNKLTALDLSALPRGLQNLYLGNNKLTELNFAKLPRGMTTLSLSDNELVTVDLSKVPSSMTTIFLVRNYLNDNDFSTIPDCCFATIWGVGKQRPVRPSVRGKFDADSAEIS